ncbi:hypothetical protein BJY04DRAFT_209612 [Aspergillus karnatakaensis]|uniref:SDR family oxidoreductase n=1 Tax=Aspergillus karnatakaensis TaxID=1810916 RepID=UPI003CCCC727
MPLIWLITGTSTGFGAHFIPALLNRGDKVIATARDISKITHFKELGVEVLQWDVTSSQAELNENAKKAIEVYGRVDVLVNNAGVTQFGVLEEMREDAYVSQFRTNVFGPVNTTRAFLPHFRARKSCVIVNIGSMSAWETYPGLGAYSASKAALRYATEALSLEVSPFGIKTLLIEPGQFRTSLLSSTKPGNTFHAPSSSIPEYDAVVQPVFEPFRAVAGKQRGDPVKAVNRIIDVVKGEGEAEGREWPGELVLGEDAVGAVRGKCEQTLKQLGEWEGFVTGLDCE